MLNTSIKTILLLCLLYSNAIFAQSDDVNLDVMSYQVQLEPNIAKQYVEGNVKIDFLTGKAIDEVRLDCGNLTVTQVRGEWVKSFQQKDKKLIIFFSNKSKAKRRVHIFYAGTPVRGIVFSSQPLQMYTFYFTSEWMVCHDVPADRASIKMDILLPGELTAIASGTLVGKKKVEDKKVLYSWNQKAATPPYTYGFAIGSFTKVEDTDRGIALGYYSGKHDATQLATIFKSSKDMLQFFEEKAGVPYFQTSYDQILIGNHYQEMSGFAILKESYGQLVLADSTEINLIAHELAHQWWGNMISCENLGHFWLNEAFATYMSAAYNEYRFGREKYRQNINAYYEVYQKIKAKGADKSLIFQDWSNPSADDRNLVYFKGAYVLHCLREELGEEDFWKGIKYYSQQHYGKSVLTQDFQVAMEKKSKRSLLEFFNKWIY